MPSVTASDPFGKAIAMSRSMNSSCVHDAWNSELESKRYIRNFSRDCWILYGRGFLGGRGGPGAGAGVGEFGVVVVVVVVVTVVVVVIVVVVRVEGGGGMTEEVERERVGVVEEGEVGVGWGWGLVGRHAVPKSSDVKLPSGGSGEKGGMREKEKGSDKNEENDTQNRAFLALVSWAARFTALMNGVMMVNCIFSTKIFAALTSYLFHFVDERSNLMKC